MPKSLTPIWGPTMPDSILKVDGLYAGYADTRVLFGSSFEVGQGELVTLLGRNGVGKTTTLKALLGLVPPDAGSVHLNGKSIAGKRPEAIARAGMAYCPEDRGIYSRLTVEENLEISARVRSDAMSTDEVFDFFPNLRERRQASGAQLSGGEQQMLAIGRTLRTGASVVLLDEPTEGLAPAIVQSIADMLRQMKARGVAVLIVEQNFRFAASVADRHYVMELGAIAEHFHTHELEANEARINSLLGI